MRSRRIRAMAVPAVLTVLLPLAGCGGHTATRAAQVTVSATVTTAASPSSSAGAEPLSIANVYQRALHESASYAGLRGTVSLRESSADGTLQLTGSFATNLRDYADHTSDLKLQAAVTPPVPLAVRAVDTTIYYRQGVEAWQNVTRPRAGSNTAQAASRRDACAQLLAGLDPLEYVDLLSAPHGLRELPAAGGAGGKGFTGTVDVSHTDTAAIQYSPTLLEGYAEEGLTTKTFTATFDSQVRPITLYEHLTSGKLTIDYHVTITGYSATKVSAPI